MWAPKLRNGVHSRSRMEQTGMNLSVCGTGNGAIAPVPSPGSRCTVNYSPRSLQSTCRRNIRVIAAVACELADTIIYFGDAVVAQWFILPILNTNAFLKAQSLFNHATCCSSVTTAKNNLMVQRPLLIAHNLSLFSQKQCERETVSCVWSRDMLTKQVPLE